MGKARAGSKMHRTVMSHGVTGDQSIFIGMAVVFLFGPFFGSMLTYSIETVTLDFVQWTTIAVSLWIIVLIAGFCKKAVGPTKTRKERTRDE